MFNIYSILRLFRIRNKFRLQAGAASASNCAPKAEAFPAFPPRLNLSPRTLVLWNRQSQAEIRLSSLLRSEIRKMRLEPELVEETPAASTTLRPAPTAK